jgi:hypothetical protein
VNPSAAYAVVEMSAGRLLSDGHGCEPGRFRALQGPVLLSFGRLFERGRRGGMDMGARLGVPSYQKKKVGV